MKLLIITSSFPRSEDDMAGRFVLEHTQELRARGAQCQVLTWASDTYASSEVGGVRVRRVTYAPSGFQNLFYGSGAPENLSRAPVRALLTLPALAAMTAAALPYARESDLVIGHWAVPGGTIARGVGAATGVPSLVVGHSGGMQLLDAMPRLARAPFVRPLRRGPVTVSSCALADKARAMGIVASVLPMGFRPIQARASGRDWMFMGRLEPIKGIARVLPGFVDTPYRLRIAGAGGLRESLEREARARSANVGFVGVVDTPGKRDLFNASRFALFPSIELKGRHEGLPVSLLECAGAGVLPVVGTIPGVEDLLASPDFQILPRSPEQWPAFFKELSRLSDDELARLSELQRSRVYDLAWERHGEVWSDCVSHAARRAPWLPSG